MKRLFEDVGEMIHMRVFELRGSQYVLIGSEPAVTLEEYVTTELEAGYMLADTISYDMNKIRVSTSYAPAAVGKYLTERKGLTENEIKDSV